MKFLKQSLIALTLVLTATSCSNDDDSTSSKTNAKINLTSASGSVSGITVYVYDETTWEVTGDNPLFADGQAASNDEGVATFSNLEYPNVFNDINNNQNTMRFSAHYSRNGVEKTKVTAITFEKGDTKTGTILLD